jgi:lipooligosaccharide transport system ATP-binding protein
MKILYGKAKPDPGPDTIIDVFGCHPRSQALSIKAFSGIVPQQDNLDVELNVRDNLLIYSRFYGIAAREAGMRIAELLEFMELQEKAGVKIRELSGGMQRRLTIARALLNRPKLLILDEPTTGLDPQVRHLIWNKIRELKEMGVTVLLTTHYMEEAFQICDRIIIMDKGKKMMEGNPRQLMSANLEDYVMEIYGVSREALESGLQGRTSEIRCEFFQETLFVYSNDTEKLSRFAESLRIKDYHVRQSNLEDLFLKVTGRSLNELQ